MTFVRSIRWRIQLWYGLLLTLSVVGLLVAYYYKEQEARIEGIDQVLHQQMGRISPVCFGIAKRHIAGQNIFENAVLQESPQHKGGDRLPHKVGEPPTSLKGMPDPLGPPPVKGAVRELIAGFQAEAKEKGFWFDISTKGGEEILEVERPSNLNLGESGPPPRGGLKVEWHGDQRIIFGPIPRTGMIRIGMSKQTVIKGMMGLKLNLIAVGVAIIGVGLTVGWFLSAIAVKPIKAISNTAHRIAEGKWSERIDVDGQQSELGDLALTLNASFDRIESYLEQQTRFTADASHELRTPLNAITLECGIAKKEAAAGQDVSDSFDVCLNAARHMNGVIESLIHIARIDSGEERLNLDEVDVEPVMQQAIDIVQPLAGEKEIELDINLESFVAKVDAQMLRQAFINILSNGIHYTPHGQGVEVTMKSMIDHIAIDITDTGPGIPEEDLEHIFRRFYRASKARSSHEKKSGLGLPITRAMIESHGGKVFAKNVEQGARFRILLGSSFNSLSGKQFSQGYF